MSNAVSQLSGRDPVIYHSDHSNPQKPIIRTLKEELNRVIRSRVLNPKWLAGMREHGYKGAFEMTASVDYMFAYDATTNLIDDYQYKKVADTLLFDPQNQHFLQQNNPHALEEMAERLLEATQRGMWENPEGYENTRVGKYLENLEGKLLVIHGSVDPVVVPQHSMTLLKEAVEKEVQIDFFTYPMHEHNVRGKDRVHLIQKMLDYIVEYNK